MSKVAVLYVDENGPYMARDDIDAWGPSRDARIYSGPAPVVAHPPCGPWGALRHLYKGAEHDCAPIAVEQVRQFGGVLEHPARSRLWAECNLPMPGSPVDAFGGFTIQVDQCAWGHVARKTTWLYFVGIPIEKVRVGVLTGGTPTHWISGFRTSTGRSPDHYAKNGSAVPPGIKICSAQQRRRTPPLFADWLVSLAREAQQLAAREAQGKGES